MAAPRKKRPAGPAPGSLGALVQPRLRALTRSTLAPDETSEPFHHVPRAKAPRPVVVPPQAEEVPMAAQVTRYWVRWVNPETDVFRYCGVAYDHGQLLQMGSSANDEKLQRIMFVALVESPRLCATCGVCGADFVSERFLNAHGAKRHRDRFATTEELEIRAGMSSEYGDAAVVDITGEAKERRLMEEFPLALENTKASRDA
jgi:hypothetical protein